MGLLPDTQNCGLHMRQECRKRFPRHRLQRKPSVSDPGMHHGTCVTHVPWCMSGSLTRGAGKNVPGIPGSCATHNFAYLARGPCHRTSPIGLLTWYPVMKSIESLQLIWKFGSIDEIHRCPILKWVAETWLHFKIGYQDCGPTYDYQCGTPNWHTGTWGPFDKR